LICTGFGAAAGEGFFAVLPRFGGSATAAGSAPGSVALSSLSSFLSASFDPFAGRGCADPVADPTTSAAVPAESLSPGIAELVEGEDCVLSSEPPQADNSSAAHSASSVLTRRIELLILITLTTRGGMRIE
jgi:hypothetical protein